MEKRERLSGIDFARAFCAVGIIAYHFYCHSNSRVKLVYETVNSAWGGLIVAVFFIISGGMLYYNHKEIPSLRQFYYKRLKSLLPAFYIAYLYFYFETVYSTGAAFFGGEKWKIVLTLLGMDGYFLYKGGNYYLIGEWFLGAIIILYAVYPLLATGLRKKPVITTALVFAAYAWMCVTDVFEIHPDCNAISCIASFYTGMLVVKYKKKILDNRWLLIPSVFFAVFLCIYDVPGVYNLKNVSIHISGLSIFLILYHTGCVLMKCRPLARLITLMGALSYPVFLLQHRVIQKVLGAVNPESTVKSLALLIFTIIMTFIYAKVLQIVTDAVLASPLYKRFEGFVLGKEKKEKKKQG